MKSKLILGTAEFNPEGYAGKPPINIKEIRKILRCAKVGGINILDTAEAYNCQEVIRNDSRGFCIYTKTHDPSWKVTLNWGDNELRGILYHYQPNEPKIDFPFIHRWVNLGASVYDISQLPEEKTRIIQVPFNITNKVFIDCFTTYRTVFVRSAFGRGSLLNDHSIKECLDYIISFRPDGIIVGVNSVKELEEIFKAV